MESEKNTRLKEIEKKGWILIGEIEWGETFPFGKYKPDDSNGPIFLYTKSSHYENEMTYYYSFCSNIFTTDSSSWILVYKKRYSINTILTDFISCDLIYEYSPLSKGRPIQKSENLKIKLVGGKWLYPNKKRLFNKITLDELEETFRSNKEEKWKLFMKNNQFLKEEDKKDLKIKT